MWSRRAFVVLAALAAYADDREDALAAIEPLAAALSEGDGAGFMKRVPRDTANYSELETNVGALLGMAEVTSSIEVTSASEGKAELDWQMHIRSRERQMLLERRRGTVNIEFRGRELKALTPASFFAPPAA
jgi:chaperonin GroEL (HSP60 family)